MDKKKLPEYEVPAIVSYTDEEIMEHLGPAETGYNYFPYDNAL